MSDNFRAIIKDKSRNVEIKKVNNVTGSKFKVDGCTYKLDPNEIYFLNFKKYGLIPYTVSCSYYNKNNPLPLKSDFKSVEVTATALTNMIENNVLEQMYATKKTNLKNVKIGAIIIAIFVVVGVLLQVTGVIDMNTIMAGLK